MKDLRCFLTLGICVLTLSACKDIDLGTIDLSGPYEHVQFSGSFENADGVATILSFRVLIDDNVAQSTTLTQPAAASRLTGSWPVGDGRRRLKIVLDGQTVSPNLYRITSLVVEHHDSQGRIANRIELDPRTASLATGEAIEWIFRL